MGTTLNTINAGGGIRCVWVVAIEGYPNLITNHADTSAVVTAWSGTEWSAAISGLSVSGDYSQSIEPWQRSLEPNTLTFRIMDADGNDTLGKVLFASNAGNETELTAAIDCDDTTLTVASTANFAASGSLYCGIETITYTGKTATTFTGCTRGRYSPFSRSSGTANQFGRDHTFVSAGEDVRIQTKVTDAPRLWTGRRVGLWMHRIVGTTLDVKAQAHPAFAGQIADYHDSPTGETVIQCDDVKARVKNCTLMRDQFVGTVEDGLYLRAGQRFNAIMGLVHNASSAENKTANSLVVTTGASGSNQIETGYYSASEIASAITTWLAGELTAARLTGTWTLAIVGTEQGDRMRLSVGNVNADYWEAKLRLLPEIAEFLGYGSITTTDTVNGIAYRSIHCAGNGTGDQHNVANDAPKRQLIVPLANPDFYRMTFSTTRGTWINQASSLPQFLQPFALAEIASEWGVFKIGNVFALAGKISDKVYDVLAWSRLTALMGGSPSDVAGLADSDSGTLIAEQVFMYEGHFRDIVMRMMTSTGTSGYNHATYDDFPEQMGAAIPWEVCGTALYNSLLALDAESAAVPLVVIDKPTPLEQVLLADLLLRTAWIIWHEGALQIAQFQSPTGALAEHVFSESNKGSAIADDPQRVVPTLTGEHLVNVLKISYNRRAFGSEDYAASATFKHAPSISDYGESKAFTIKLRNAYGGDYGSGDAVEDLIAEAVGKLLPIWGRPVYVLRGRTIQPEFYEQVACGDLGTITDSHVRNPSTGARGIGTRPCVVLAKRHSWGTDGDLVGEVDLLISERANTTIYSPASGLDETSYVADTPSAGQSTITAVTEHSDTGADIDHFATGDVVSIIEVDPSTAASAARWNVTITSASGGNYVLDANLASFDTTGATKYRMVSQSYTSAVATQQVDAYQADDSDLQVLDSRVPYEYGRFTSTTWTANASTELPERHSTDMYGDGVPMSSAYHAAAAKFIQNFIDYKGAIQCPQLFRTNLTTAGTTGDYLLILVCPIFVGPGNLGGAGLNRSVSIAPMMRADALASATVRVTFSLYPPSGTSLTDVTFSGPYEQVTFSSSSTTYAIATAQDLAQVSHMLRGFGFMSIELLAGASADPELTAISEWQQNPRT